MVNRAVTIEREVLEDMAKKTLEDMLKETCKRQTLMAITHCQVKKMFHNVGYPCI